MQQLSLDLPLEQNPPEQDLEISDWLPEDGHLLSRHLLSQVQGQQAGLHQAGLIAGVDEVGRGALFGPVVAAAVILPTHSGLALRQAGVTDSKKLLPAQRESLATQIQSIAIDCKIGIASVQEIDRLNILQASLLAMRRAVKRLQPQPQVCLIDGNQPIPDLWLPQQTIVKGDCQSLSIAAASIVAKVWRDRLMVRLASRYPGYGLDANKGYGTAKHRQAIQQQGISYQHRRSFSPCCL